MSTRRRRITAIQLVLYSIVLVSDRLAIAAMERELYDEVRTVTIVALCAWLFMAAFHLVELGATWKEERT